LVEKGANINKANENGETPLFISCKNGNEAIVKYLVKKGANIDKGNKDDETPLFILCKNGYEAIVRYLIEKRVDINKNMDSKSLLYYARKREKQNIVQYLFEHNAV